MNQPQDAERALAGGLADAVIMNRALICDPKMPSLAKAGLVEDIRACIACNQACIGHFLAGYPISCIQHPETGRELLYGRRVRATRAKRVLVAGGGPAGLKAAAVAAERGHSVTLFEAARRIGGQILLAEQLPDRVEFGGAASNLAREAERAGVKVVTKTVVDLQLVRSERPDAVVVATGARPRRPPIEIIGSPRIVDAWEVINGASLPSGRIVVADWKADWVGAGVARLLAQRGHRVVLAVDTHYACERLQQYVRDFHVAALLRERVEIMPLVRLFGADDSAVYLKHVLTREPVVIEDVSGLVLAQGHVPVDALVRDLAAEDVEVVAIGDRLTPRSVEEAVLEGLVAGTVL